MSESKSATELERLLRKYYGYVADLEGSGVEAFDLLFVRDKIQHILNASQPDEELPGTSLIKIHELDELLWQERDVFLNVVGEQELKHARQQQSSPRSHWWWYLDELKFPPDYDLITTQWERLSQTFAQVR